MNQVDFTDTLWLFASPWCESKLERGDQVEELALAWSMLWNFTVDPTSTRKKSVARACAGLFDLDFDELVEILAKRKLAFFPDENRLIDRYRVVHGVDEGEFAIHVIFLEEE